MLSGGGLLAVLGFERTSLEGAGPLAVIDLQTTMHFVPQPLNSRSVQKVYNIYQYFDMENLTE